jgi:hypothetical protein
MSASVTARASSPRRGYKWIAREIERLDPEVDYARIWSLTAAYYPDETFFNLLYALGMPRITQNPHGSALLVRRTRKAVDRQQERADDTLASFWRWYEYGPHHLEAQRSLEQVNRIHEALAKNAPDAFPDEDFVYTTCLLGTTGHEVRLKVGLPGFTEKQRIAAHHFWRDITLQMRGPRGYIEDYPQNFEGMQAVVKAHDARPWPKSDTGRELAQYVIQQFCQANFPKPLHGVGRQMILALQEPYIRRLCDMGEPNPVAAWLLRRVIFLKGWLAEKVLPDPRLSTPERARARGRAAGQHQEPRMVTASEVPFEADGRSVPKPPPSAAPAKVSRCPFH